MSDNGFWAGTGIMEYGKAKGRIGRKELSYRMLMEIRKGDAELTDKLIHSLPSGIGRLIKDHQVERFLLQKG